MLRMEPKKQDTSPQQVTAATTTAMTTCATERASTLPVEVKDPQEESNDNEHTVSFDLGRV